MTKYKVFPADLVEQVEATVEIEEKFIRHPDGVNAGVGIYCEKNVIPLMKWMYKRVALFNCFEDDLTIDNLCKKAENAGFHHDNNVALPDKIAYCINMLIKLDVAQVSAGDQKPFSQLVLHPPLFRHHPPLVPELVWD